MIWKFRIVCEPEECWMYYLCSPVTSLGTPVQLLVSACGADVQTEHQNEKERWAKELWRCYVAGGRCSALSILYYTFSLHKYVLLISEENNTTAPGLQEGITNSTTHSNQGEHLCETWKLMGFSSRRPDWVPLLWETQGYSSHQNWTWVSATTSRYIFEYRTWKHRSVLPFINCSACWWRCSGVGCV